jgi:hypothetical protein
MATGYDYGSRSVSPQPSKQTAAPLGRPRRTWLSVVVIVVVVLVAFGSVFVLLVDNDDDSTDVSTDSPRSSASSIPAVPNAASVAGKPCVPVTGTPPAGAPAVPVREGPPPTQLVAEDLQPGTGAEVAPGATVTVDYIGVACSSGVIFDSSYSRGQPAPFPLDQVIPGFSQGIAGMKVGGVRLLGIPPDLAYGEQGQPPDILPGETLWFVVTVRETQ